MTNDLRPTTYHQKPTARGSRVFSVVSRESSVVSSAASGRRGFTLIEMLVALALFTTTISIAVGGFITALRTQRQISSLIAANNNLSLTLEQMAREIRTGYNFCRQNYNGCYPGLILSPPGCNNGGPLSIPAAITPMPDELHFANANTQVVRYYLDSVGEAIKRDTSDSLTGAINTETITSDNVRVRSLRFLVRGYANQDCWPPRVTIVVGVSSNDPVFVDTIMYLQTTVSSRQIDS